MLTAVFRRPSCLRHPIAWHNRLDSFSSQMRRLSLLQMAMFKSLQKGLPCKALPLPLQPLLLPRKQLSQSWDTGDISNPLTPFDRLALSGCIVWLIRDESTCVELQGSCMFQRVSRQCGGVVLCSSVSCMLTCQDAFRIHACCRKHSLSLPACKPPSPPLRAACIYPDAILALAIKLKARMQTHHAFSGKVLFLFPVGKSRN